MTNTTIKTWQERLPEGVSRVAFDYAHVSAMQAEIADLRAALAAKGQQEPVAEVFYKTGDYLDCREIRVIGSKAQFYANFPHGTKLYAAPVAQQSEAGALALDEQRIREIGAGVYGFRIKSDDVRFAQEVLQAAATEAGAPTAAADELLEIGNRLANTVEVVAPAMLSAGTTECLKRLVAEWRSATSGRESAAPAAPVREGDREQDAREIDHKAFCATVSAKPTPEAIEFYNSVGNSVPAIPGTATIPKPNELE